MATKKKTMKEVRTEKGMSQKAFAESLGISVSSLGSYENGKKAPSDSVIDKIKELYGVDVSGEFKAMKKETAPRKSTKKAAEPAEAAETAAKSIVVLQSPDGAEITVDALLEKTGAVDTIYVRADQGKAYWVRGEEDGAVDLW